VANLTGKCPVAVGTAGWSIPREISDQFQALGSGLERYADRFSVAEINSSFHRPHRLSTWQRWHDSVPASFRFSVKIPKAITHQAKLRDCDDLLIDFLAQAHVLAEKLAVLLIQLPPKLEFDADVARAFFENLLGRTPALLACEPRHPSWFTLDADALLRDLKVARVAADPAITDAAAAPGGWPGLAYWRLHGSPAIYRSSYSDRIRLYADRLLVSADRAQTTWCIFDNTASSAGAGDALALIEALRSSRQPLTSG
jgi:uncharacterized protein YecE (DUF72 family)